MNPQLQQLIDRYVDGSASAEEIRQLDELVRQDASVRQALFRAATMEVHLRRLLATTEADWPVALPIVRRRACAVAWRTVLGYAAVLLLTISGWAGTLFFARQYHALSEDHGMALQAMAELRARGPDSAPPVEPVRPVAADRVIETRGLVLALPEGDGKSIPVSVGGPIPAGRSLWTCPWGAAAMRLADGSSMQLDRNTTVAVSEADGKRRMAIKRGIFFLTRQGAAREGGIVVTFDHAAVEVIDAQVAVAVDAGRTLVEVAEGQVQVTPQPDGPSVAVPAGHYLIIGAATPPRVLAGRLAWRLEPAKPGAYSPTLP